MMEVSAVCRESLAGGGKSPHSLNPMQDAAQYSLEDAGADAARLVLSGQLTLASIGPLEHSLKSIAGPLASIDLAAVDDIDTVGAWVVCRLAREHHCDITGASEAAERLLAAMRGIDPGGDTGAARLPAWERVPMAVGDKMYAARSGIYGVVGFFGQILIGVANQIRHPTRFPVKALVHQMELVGVSALPIIGLMSFLIGIVIAQQGSVQLEQFGAEALTVNEVAKELAAINADLVGAREGTAGRAALLDARDKALRGLAEEFGIQPTINANGTADVTLAGTPTVALVTGASAQAVSVNKSADRTSNEVILDCFIDT